MRNEVINTIPARKNDEFINSSIDDLVPIPRESEVTSDGDLECDMPATTPLPTTDVKEENFDINSPLRERVVNFLIDNEDVAGLVLIDSMSRSSKTSDLFEELIAEFGLDDSIPTKIDDRYHDSEESSLDLPLPDHKHICLREVEKFDPFFSLTQSGGKTRVMETPSFSSHHMSRILEIITQWMIDGLAKSRERKLERKAF
ncbi:hypothetical protein Tco_1002508 [Tanacetum coccineum]|uniref:Uncharacterized protein n=1 Tax=Tanacetum coccineum TaxID=301880 RepID=A0ABQ5F6P8_9ASTR